MKRKTLTLILITTLIFSFCGILIRPVESQSLESIYIRDDGSVEGTEKIQRIGNVYTFTDNIDGSLVVEKNNVIVDGNGYTLQGMGIGNGTTLLERKNVTVKNLKINHFATGIYIYDYSNQGDNTIAENNVVNCSYGLHIESSHNNTIIENNFSNNSCAVFTSASHFNVFKNNQLFDNQRNLLIQGGYLAAYTQYIDTSNTVNGRSVYYWIEEQNRTVPSDAGCVALIGCENIKAQNLKLTRNGQGILLFSTNNSTIIGNIIEDNDMGIFSSDSLNITICKNVIANNSIGIRLDGKFPVYSQNNVIHENNIINNDVGIQLFESSNNTISKNHIANNGYGISIIRLGGETDNNLIHHNNFVNSTADVPGYWHIIVFEEVWVPPPKNFWEYNNEGNYWSDYTARYHNATELNDLGVWDTPYFISDNNQDNYPLLDPVVIPELPFPSHYPQPTLTPTPYQEPQQKEQFEIIVGVAVAVAVIGAGLGLLIYLIKRK